MGQLIQNYPMWVILAVGILTAFLRMAGLGAKTATTIGLALLLGVAYLSSAGV